MESCNRAAKFDNEETCYVCQTDKKEPKTNYRTNIPVTKVPNMHAVKLQCELWKKKIDRPGYITVALGILDNLFSESENPTTVWHYTKCRPNFMSKSILDNYTDKIELDDINPSDTDGVDSDHDSTLNSMFLRSQSVAYNAKNTA